MISVEKWYEGEMIEKWHEGGGTVPVTWISHHLVSLLSSWIGPKLTSEGESYVYIQSISLCDLSIQPVWPIYVTCVCGLSWLV